MQSTSIPARKQFIEELAPLATDSTDSGVDAEAHSINVVMRSLPSSDFVDSINALNPQQRSAVLSDFTDTHSAARDHTDSIHQQRYRPGSAAGIPS